MKKFLFILLILLIASFAAQFAVYKGFKHLLDAKSNFRLSRYFRQPRHKYFVLGNSRGANSVDEKYAVDSLKLDIINLSYNGMPYPNASDLLDEVNRSNTNAVIFFEITCIDDDDFDGTYSYYISNSDIIKKRYASGVYSWPTLLRLNNEFFLRNIYYWGRSDNDWINRTTITQNIIDQIPKDSSYTMFRNPKQFAYRLAELQKKCTGHGNSLVYFLAPYYPAVLRHITDYQSTLNYFQKNDSTYKFINLNAIRLSGNMFADREHTNINGAVILTDSLLSPLKKMDKPLH